MTSEFKNSLKFETNDEVTQQLRELDAYREYISYNLPSYILFVETLNQAITFLEKNNIIGKIKMKTRTKAAKSSWINTNIKELDDVFGFSFVAQNERDKEILMLLIHNLFYPQHTQEKNHNKSNGYVAHHCIGALRRKRENIETINLEDQILQSETYQLRHEYRDMSRKEQEAYEKKQIYEKVHRYPTLRKELKEGKGLDTRTKYGINYAIKTIEEFMNKFPQRRKRFPVTEVQFKTLAVEHEIKYGNAKHDKYKSEDKKEARDEIISKYLSKQLVRGIDFPFVFYRNNNAMALESTNRSLIYMWPFLEKTIGDFKKENKIPVASYDMYLSKVFPELEPYVEKLSEKEPCIPVGEETPDEIWSVLKQKIINKDFTLPFYEDIEGEKING